MKQDEAVQRNYSPHKNSCSGVWEARGSNATLRLRRLSSGCATFEIIRLPFRAGGANRDPPDDSGQPAYRFENLRRVEPTTDINERPAKRTDDPSR